MKKSFALRVDAEVYEAIEKWAAEHAKVGYTKWPIIWYPVEATVFTAIWWLIEEKPFRKKK